MIKKRTILLLVAVLAVAALAIGVYSITQKNMTQEKTYANVKLVMNQ